MFQEISSIRLFLFRLPLGLERTNDTRVSFDKLQVSVMNISRRI